MLPALLLAALTAVADNPQTATTTDGRSVILNPNGTWSFADGSPPPLAVDHEAAAQALKTEISEAINSGDIAQAKRKTALMLESYASTSAARRMTQTAQELGLIDKDAPDRIEVEKWLANEAPIDLQRMAPTVLVFWETWCPHCVREVPKLQTLMDTYEIRGLEVVGITRITKTSTEEAVEQFIQEHKIKFPIGKDIDVDGKGKLSSFFAVKGIPAVAVVMEGKVIWRGHPGRINDSLVLSWLGGE